MNGPRAAPVTVVFCHGYTLNQDCWHFQRRDLSDHRLVFWDQRDHGRSGRSKSGAASIDQLGADLKAVIDAVAPGDARVVLVGHSMGGMTIMALAEQHPDLFGTKVAGSVLINTAAHGLDSGSPWMLGPIRPLLSQALPGLLSGAAKGRRAILVEQGRRVDRSGVPWHAVPRVRGRRGQPGPGRLPGADDQRHPDRGGRQVRPGAAAVRQARLAGHARPGAGDACWSARRTG